MNHIIIDGETLEAKDFINKLEAIVKLIPDDQKEAHLAIGLLLKINNMLMDQITLSSQRINSLQLELQTVLNRQLRRIK